MTIDQGLTRLTERHEALTGHVEMLTADVAQLTTAVAKTRSTLDDLLGGIGTLTGLVRSHEMRIERLEGR
jgi:prefoldin subunit 5